MTLEIGHQLQQGRYQIHALLGRGGMGTVYLATDRNLSNRQVAIKENVDTAPATQEQFQYEAILLSRLTHPNLPRVTDHFIEPSGRQYLVMDYIEGDDLRDLLRSQNEPLVEDLVLQWFDQVIDALAYMHSWIDPITRKPTPIIHRDIKPGNIKRTPNGRIVLVDFGVAKIDETTEGTVIGAKAITPGYSPLEQYTGGTDARSDIYALGATLYALLAGQRPPDATALAAGVPLPSPRQFNRQLSRTTERAILRALALHPSERFQNVEELRAALPRPREGGSVPLRGTRAGNGSSTASPTAPEERSFKTRWTYWSSLAALIMLTLLIVAITALPNTWLATWRPAPEERAAADNFVETGAGGNLETVNSDSSQSTAPLSVTLAASQSATAPSVETIATTPETPEIATPQESGEVAVALLQSDVLTPTVDAAFPSTTTSTAASATSAPTLTAALIPSTTVVSAQVGTVNRATATATSTASATPTEGVTPTAIATATEPPTATSTATSTAAPLATATSTHTALPTATDTPLPTATNTQLPTATDTPLPTATNTSRTTATNTSLPTATATSQPTATSSATSAPTSTSLPTSTPSPRPTATPTEPPVPTALPEAGDLLVHEADGARYRYVPAGPFTMGSTVNPAEGPVHVVNLHAFWIMETEVTNELYGRCVAAGTCVAPHNSHWQDAALANHPVTHVDWNQAATYAEWVGGRLPTEAEWEKAARGTDERTFPWPGEDTDSEHLNFNAQATTPVGSFGAGASPYGLLDMAGNVEEWVIDRYNPTYYAQSPAENPTGPEEGMLRVVRGGSFTSNRGFVRTTARGHAVPASAFATVGFRVVLTE